MKWIHQNIFLFFFLSPLFVFLNNGGAQAKSLSQVQAIYSDSETQNIEELILSTNGSDPNLLELLKQLFDRNPEIKDLLYQIRVSESQKNEAPFLDDPHFGVGVKNIPTDNPSLSRSSMSGIELSLKQAIPFPSKLVTKTRLEEAQARQAKYVYIEKLNQLVTKFKQAYFDYAYTREAILIHQQNRDRYQSLNNTLEARYTTDNFPLQDLLKIKVAMNEIDSALIGLRQLSKTYLARINTLILQDVSHAVRVSHKNNFTSMPSDLNRLIRRAQTTRPWLKKMEQEVKETKLDKSLAKQELLPDFDFEAGYMFRDNVAGDPMSGQDFASGGVSINVPFLWSLPSHASKIREKGYALHSKNNERDSVEQEVIYQVTKSFYEAKQLRDQVSLLHSQIVPNSRAAFNSSKTAYEAGDVDFLEVITNQNSLFMNELNLAKFKSEYEKKISLLEMAVGEPL